MPSIPLDRRLILFGRYPVPGRTKTRLIPVLGPLGAAEMQRCWTEQALTLLDRVCLAPVDFAFTGGGPKQMRRWLGKGAVHLVPQGEGDLGRRMELAMARAFAHGARQVVLVGTDIPGMTASHLAAAFDALNTHEVVLGPTHDGGYWLVGCRRPLALFDDIAWSTSEVFKQTLSRVERAGAAAAVLHPLSDIDSEADLRQWRPPEKWPSPYLSVVIPTLDEADCIARTIAGVQSVDTEIIVADGGSRDQTRQVAEASGARVIAAPRGRARQQNLGARYARGRVLLFLHADTHLPADFGAQIFDLLLDPRVALGAFRFGTDWDHWAMHCIERSANMRARWMKMPYGDQALFMRKALFEQIGGFPDVPIAEDLFLARKMKRRGRIALTPGSAVTSGRRWRTVGIGRTTLVNYRIAIGCMLGRDPRRLAPLYNKDRHS